MGWSSFTKKFNTHASGTLGYVLKLTIFRDDQVVNRLTVNHLSQWCPSNYIDPLEEYLSQQ
jgi:hypothetical protein